MLSTIFACQCVRSPLPIPAINADTRGVAARQVAGHANIALSISRLPHFITLDFVASLNVALHVVAGMSRD